MPDIAIQIDGADAAQDALRRLASPDTLRTALEAAGAAAREETLEHFREREAEPSRNEGFPRFGQPYPKSYFWSGNRGTSVAEQVRPGEYDPADATLTIRIDSPALAHKADPNPPPIRPKGGRKLLAIPANARAAAWEGMPRDFSVPGGMKFGYATTPEGRPMKALVARENYLRVAQRGRNAGQRVAAAAGKGTLGALDPQFWLVKQVQTRHDPRAMPDARRLAAAANARAAAALRQLVKPE